MGEETPQFPGIPGGMPAGFDMSALQNVLNDPSIKVMAEQMSANPAFAQMTEALQSSMGGGAGMQNGDASASPGGMPGFDNEAYMKTMGGVLQNPQFMEMAEKLGQQIMSSDPSMMQMMQGMQDPKYRENIEGRLNSLKADPKLSGIMREIETGGPAAMMKYWNDPDILKQLGGAMGGAFNGEELGGIDEGGAAEEAEDEDEEANVHSAASSGNTEELRGLLENGAVADEKDEEGRTALHFACGYGELPCAKVLLEFGAKVDATDLNDNTALHYAAGYGQAEGVQLLLDRKCDIGAKNKDGKTSLEVAELNNQDDVVKVFKSHNSTSK